MLAARPRESGQSRVLSSTAVSTTCYVDILAGRRCLSVSRYIGTYSVFPAGCLPRPASMTYRKSPQHGPPRPLIDLIPDHAGDVDASDEEDDFYGPDDDFLMPLKWQAALARTTDRIPRRLRRWPKASAALALALLVAWVTFAGPRWAAYRQERRLLDDGPAMAFGSNAPPPFRGVIQVRDMDGAHLPTKHALRRLVFVGDVHGCRDDLARLLTKTAFDSRRDHLVLTGDMVAKGPDSPGVVQLAQEMGASCVRGNWEDRLLLSLADARAAEPASNPHATNLRQLARQFSGQQIAWLHQCPVILRVGPVPARGNLVAVHAGLVPDVPLERQDPFHVMNMRTIDLKTRIPSPKHRGTPWEKLWNHRQKKLHQKDTTTVVYGHNQKRGLNIRDYSFGLDTGCVSGGKLTALVVNGHGQTEIVHVKCGKARASDEE